MTCSYRLPIGLKEYDKSWALITKLRIKFHRTDILCHGFETEPWICMLVRSYSSEKLANPTFWQRFVLISVSIAKYTIEPYNGWYVTFLAIINRKKPFRIRHHSKVFIQKTFINPYPTAFPYGNGMVLHFYQQQESSTTRTVHKVINKGLKTYV